MLCRYQDCLAVSVCGTLALPVGAISCNVTILPTSPAEDVPFNFIYEILCIRARDTQIAGC